MESRSKETGSHVIRVGLYAKLLAQLHNQNQAYCDKISLAAQLHDVGKVGVPDLILNKPAKLDADEWEIMKQHTTKGWEILKGTTNPVIDMAANIAIDHHERWDGTGYPGPIEPDAELGPPEIPTRKGLKGKEIPLFARIVGLADVYDALSSKRAYKDAWPESKVLSLLTEESGGHFDPELVEILMERIDEIRAVHDRYLD